MQVVAFVDTDVLEQFPPLEQLDWLSITQADEVRLVISPVVVRQLNRHKDNSQNARLHRKATDVLRTLNGYYDSGGEVKIRTAVTVSLEPQEPLIDFGAYQLEKDIEDDQLVASAISESLKGMSKVLLLSGDLGLLLKARSQEKITAVRMPADKRLPQEESQEAKELRELRSKWEKAQNARPSLKLTAMDGASFASIELDKSKVERSESENLDDILSAISKNYRKLPTQNASDPNSLRSMLQSMSMLGVVSNETYNMEIDTYLAECRKWIPSYIEWRKRDSLTCGLKMELKNVGGAYAEDIEVHLHLPDGFEVSEERERKPKQPNGPLPPDMRAGAMAIPQLWRPPQMLMPDFSPPDPVRISSIKKTNSYDINVVVEKLKHGYASALPELLLTFADINSVRGFTVDYRITEKSHPDCVEGKLDVRVELV